MELEAARAEVSPIKQLASRTPRNTKKLFTLSVITTEAHRYHFKMLFSAVAILAAASGLLGLSSAHNIQMKAHSRECFHEQLHKDDKMTVTFQVGDREFGGSGNLELDFWVY